MVYDGYWGIKVLGYMMMMIYIYGIYTRGYSKNEVY